MADQTWGLLRPDRSNALHAAATVGADQIDSHEAEIAAIRADERFRGGD